MSIYDLYERLGHFDFILTAPNLENAEALILLRRSFPGFPDFQVIGCEQDLKELAPIKNKRVLFLGLSSFCQFWDENSIRKLTDLMNSNSNKIVCIIDPEDSDDSFWESYFVECTEEGQPQSGPLREKYSVLQLNDPENGHSLMSEEIKLALYSSLLNFDIHRFEKIVRYFCSEQGYDEVKSFILNGRNQRKAGQEAFSDAIDYGNGVWLFTQPEPVTLFTMVAQRIYATHQAKAVIGIKTDQYLSFLLESSIRQDFVSQLRRNNIPHSVTDNGKVSVHANYVSEVIDILRER